MNQPQSDPTTRLPSNIWKMYLYHGFWDGSLAFPLPIIVLFWQDNGLSMTQIMGLQAIFAATVVVLEVPSGYLADQVGRRFTLIISAIAMAIAMVIYSLSYGFAGFLLAELIFALGISLYSGADAALIYDTLVDLEQSERYQQVWGNVFFYSKIVVAGANIAGGLLGKVNLRAAWYPGLAFALLSIVAAAWLTEPTRHKRVLKESHWRDLLRILKYALLENKPLRWLLLYAGVILTATQTGLWFYQPYFQLTGLDLAYFGLIFAVFNLVTALSSKYAHRLETYLGRRMALILLIVILALGYFLMGQVIFSLSFIFVFFHQFVRGFAGVVLTDYINQQVESDIRATVLSVRSLLGRLVYTSFLPLAGWLADRYGLTTALLWMGVITLVAGGPILGLLRRSRVI